MGFGGAAGAKLISVKAEVSGPCEHPPSVGSEMASDSVNAAEHQDLAAVVVVPGARKGSVVAHTMRVPDAPSNALSPSPADDETTMKSRARRRAVEKTSCEIVTHDA